jgi:ribosomal protein S18 acetylase RimI-like enzyme
VTCTCIETTMEQVFTADLSLPSHANAVVYLLNEYAKDEMGGGLELTDFVKQNLAQELKKRSGIEVILAFVGQDPAGFAICIEGFSSFACKPLLNIHDIAVLPKYRGRGIAKKILAQAEALARTSGCCKLTLEVLEGNKIAQGAYRSAGFEGYELNPNMGKALFWQKVLK